MVSLYLAGVEKLKKRVGWIELHSKLGGSSRRLSAQMKLHRHVSLMLALFWDVRGEKTARDKFWTEWIFNKLKTGLEFPHWELKLRQKTRISVNSEGFRSTRLQSFSLFVLFSSNQTQISCHFPHSVHIIPRNQGKFFQRALAKAGWEIRQNVTTLLTHTRAAKGCEHMWH